MSEEVKKIKRRFRHKLIIVEFILAVIFISASFGTNYYIKKQTAGQISRIVSRMVKKGDHREAVYTLGSAKLENFKSVGYFDKKGRRIFSLPPSLNELSIEDQGLFVNSISQEIYFGESSDSEVVGTLKFTFYSFYAVLFGFLLWVLALIMTLPLIRRYFNLAVEKLQLENDKKRAKDLVDLAGMVKHDLRSPLQSILMAVQTGDEISDSSREMILAGISRIEKITQDLNKVKEKEQVRELPIPQEKVQSKESCSVFTAIQDIVQEKVHTYRKVKNLSIRADFKDESIMRFCCLSDSDLKRTLSNLIDNAVESFSEKASSKDIRLSITEKNKSVEIQISDNGPGIPDIVMKRIGEKENTYGKLGGSGLGIYSSRKKVRSCGGEFSIQTSETGTSIDLLIPLAKPPAWFPESLNLSEASEYVILDDDDSVIERLKNDSGVLKGHEKKVSSFNSASQFSTWLHRNKDSIDEKSVFFIDYDLKDTDVDGLDILKLINKRFKTYLFTNNFDDFFLQRACANSGVKILPKTILGWG